MFLVAIFFVCDSFKNMRDLIGSDIPNSMLIVKMQISFLLSIKNKKVFLTDFLLSVEDSFTEVLLESICIFFGRFATFIKKNIFVANLFACTAWWNTHWIITRTQLGFLYFFNNLSSKPKQRMKPPISKTPHHYFYEMGWG